MIENMEEQHGNWWVSERTHIKTWEWKLTNVTCGKYNHSTCKLCVTVPLLSHHLLSTNIHSYLGGAQSCLVQSSSVPT